MLNGAAVATILQYNAPILVSIVAFFLWREPLTGRKIAAIVMAFAGTLLAAGIDWSAGMELTSQGFVAGLGTAVAFGAISLFGKKLSGDYHTWTILFYTFFFAALALLPLQIGRPLPQTISMSALFAFIGLLAVSTIGGYAIYTVGLQRLPASIAVIIATMEVPFSALFAYALLGQQVNVVQGVGGMLVVSGVILLSLPLRKVKFAD
jgi:drug/metabolite transporter (DMT)-like permease